MMSRPPLPQVYIDTPLAHRGLHDITKGRPENSRASFIAAIQAGYGIELDLQLSHDGHAMVFHDYDMSRLTGESGPIQLQTVAKLRECELLYGVHETIPCLEDVLEIVDGKVPLLVELKDQDGEMGRNIGILEDSVAKIVDRYAGPIAFMSFNPHSVEALARLLPQFPRGLTTCLFDEGVELLLPKHRRDQLAKIVDFEQTQSSFISHDHNNLEIARVQELKSKGVPILCWTVTSVIQEKRAREIADNVTFEHYLPT